MTYSGDHKRLSKFISAKKVMEMISATKNDTSPEAILLRFSLAKQIAERLTK